MEDVGEKIEFLLWIKRCFYYWGLLVVRNKIKVSIGVVVYMILWSYKVVCMVVFYFKSIFLFFG